MSIILFKTMIDPYLKPQTLAVQNTDAENATITVLFKDKNVMLGNSDKVLTVIDEITGTLYDIYQSELSGYKKVSGGWLAQINVTLFGRYRFKDNGYILDTTLEAGRTWSSTDVQRMRYMFLIEGSDKNGDNANANVFIGGITNYSYSFVNKSQGNKVSKTWRTVNETTTDGWRTTQYPAGKNMSEIYSSGIVDRVVPIFIKVSDAQKGWTFKNKTRIICIMDNE